MKILIAILTIFYFGYSDGYPIKEIKLNDGQQLNYELDYKATMNMVIDTTEMKMPMSMKMNYPLKVVSIDDTSFTLKSSFKDFAGTMKMQNSMMGEEMVFDIQELFKKIEITKDLKNSDALMKVSKKGVILESELIDMKNQMVNQMMNQFKSNSGAFFVPIPENSNSDKWTHTISNTTNAKGMKLGMKMTYNFHYLGSENFNGKSYYKVNFNISDIKLNSGNPMASVFDIKFKSELKGYYLVEKESGATKKNFVDGKIDMVMDMSKMSEQISNDSSLNGKMTISSIVNSEMILK
jgi:hypothetical protein